MKAEAGQQIGNGSAGHCRCPCRHCCCLGCLHCLGVMPPGPPLITEPGGISDRGGRLRRRVRRVAGVQASIVMPVWRGVVRLPFRGGRFNRRRNGAGCTLCGSSGRS
jgi:hypothetical protein